MTGNVMLTKLVNRWRRTAALSTGWRARTHNLIADELENELAADSVASAVAFRLAREWERHAEQLRQSKHAIDHLSGGLRNALIEPEPIEAANEHARLFDQAAAELRIVAGSQPDRIAR